MKKQLHKVLGRLKRGGRDDKKSSVPRITNDTLAEQREQIIAKGKRYKYPMQQTKNRTAIISSAIVVIVLLGTTFFTWWQLYRAQSSSQFLYRVTQILPLPVGKVDGETVLYSDYLMELRSALHYLTTKESLNLSSDNGMRLLAYQERLAMNKVLEQAYVRRLASQNNVGISDQTVDAYIENQIASNDIGATREDFQSVIRDYYDWTFEEYRQSVKEQLLKREVVAAVDSTARQKLEGILQQARENPATFPDLAKASSDDETTKQNGGDVGFVALSAPDPDGLTKVAAELGKNEVSDIIVGADGLYIVKTLEKRQNDVRYARIYVGFTQFSEQFAALREQGKVEEYIDIPDAPAAVQ